MLDIEVVSVSKVSEKASGAPSPVTVINADDILIYGYRSLDEVLDSVRGLHFVSDRIYSYSGVRGFAPIGDYNYRLLLMIDGVRVNSNLYDMAMLGSEFSLDLSLIDRIEIVHGPGSSIYGSNALFGVINVITRKGANLGRRITMQGDTLGDKSLLATLGGSTTSGGDYLLALSGQHAPGEAPYFPEFGSAGKNRHADYLYNQRLFGKFRHNGLEIMANLSRREKGNPAALSSGLLDPSNQFIDEQAFFNLAYRWQPSTSTQGEARLFWGGHNYAGRYLYDYPPLTLNSDHGEGRWWGTEVKLITAVGPDHRLVYGMELQRDYQLRLYNYDIEPYSLAFDSNSQRTRNGFYLQDEWRAAPNINVTLGARSDQLTGIDNQLSPRLALVWQANPRTIVKTSLGSAFRAPNAGETFWQQILGGTHELKAERINTFDTRLEHFPNADLRLTASLYAYRMYSQIAINPSYDGSTDTNYFTNLSRVDGRGVETEVEKLLDDGSHLRASLSLQSVQDEQSERPINSPNWLAKVNYDRALFSRWLLGINVQILGPMKTNVGHLGSSTVCDLTLSRRMRPDGWEFSASIHDLFSERPAQPVWEDDSAPAPRDTVPGEARSLRVSLTKKF